MEIADSLIGKKARLVAAGLGKKYTMIVGDRTVMEVE
jgi:hypothetical protein